MQFTAAIELEGRRERAGMGGTHTLKITMFAGCCFATKVLYAIRRLWDRYIGDRRGTGIMKGVHGTTK